MQDSNFKATEKFAFARVLDEMNSKSSKKFRWSVRLTSDSSTSIYIGIASKLERKDDYIENYDENSVLCTNAKSGDEIHFRFQPKLKNFSISLVHFNYSQLAIISNFRGIKNILSISMKTLTILPLYKELPMLVLLYSNLMITNLF